ncbi:alkaline phytoceramidase [Polychaeton citri CBS 116435]|uniref:Alkaline phytoceramidase n=1 Tax=Polychaeton citri CBS 116435 TaxID=1314669 RepID=A0A9P4URB7_9PEZI|nr:alkaline phytoceramidase [Polychaeton citri CBS 116435]
MPERWLPSIAYPPPQPQGYGFWAPVTSTLNWCEEDYYATPYSAEVVNTFTNLLFMYLAFKGITNCLKHGHDTIFVVTFFGYLIVGSGSFAFHATLKYPMQLVDELSMIYTTCLMFWATFGHKKTKSTQVWLGIALASLALFITLYYHYLQDPLFHQNAYAILTAIVLFRSVYLMERNIRPHYRNRQEEGVKKIMSDAERAVQKRQDERDQEILRTMWTMIAIGLSVFLGGFAIWNLDNIFCSRLRFWRREYLGLPWGILLEGHGWWHLMTGLGAYFYIVWGVWLRHCLNGRQDEFTLDWPHWWSLPQVVSTGGLPSHANGSLKKYKKTI